MTGACRHRDAIANPLVILRKRRESGTGGNDAIARLKIAIDLNPNLTWAHGNQGLWLAVSGRGDEALAPFNEALRLSPRDQFNFFFHYLGFRAVHCRPLPGSS
jgi:tetratricopeptide (TPR) repeat protein